MIEKIVIQKLTVAGKEYEYPDTTALVGKINELVDAVNSLRDDCNLLMGYIAPENKCEPAENTIMAKNANVAENPTVSKMENVDPYAEQRKWIGCLVRYKICDWQGGWHTDVLDDIVDHPIYPFKMRNGQTAQVCELVTADEIYPNKARTW